MKKIYQRYKLIKPYHFTNFQEQPANGQHSGKTASLTRPARAKERLPRRFIPYAKPAQEHHHHVLQLARLLLLLLRGLPLHQPPHRRHLHQRRRWRLSLLNRDPHVYRPHELPWTQTLGYVLPLLLQRLLVHHRGCSRRDGVSCCWQFRRFVQLYSVRRCLFVLYGDVPDCGKECGFGYSLDECKGWGHVSPVCGGLSTVRAVVCTSGVWSNASPGDGALCVDAGDKGV